MVLNDCTHVILLQEEIESRYTRQGIRLVDLLIAKIFRKTMKQENE